MHFTRFNIQCLEVTKEQIIWVKFIFLSPSHWFFTLFHRLSIIGPIEGADLQVKFASIAESLIASWLHLGLVSTASILSATSNDNLLVDKKLIQMRDSDSERSRKRAIGPHKEPRPQSSCSFSEFTFNQTSPLLEILQARHDMLYTRLFNSWFKCTTYPVL